MAIPLETLSLELLGLPASLRAQLAAKLLDSLEDTEDPDVGALGMVEAARRLQEVREGKVELQAAEDAFRQARESL